MIATVPAGAIDPRQSRPWNAVFALTSFGADQIFPEEVMFEICKHIAENRQRLVDFHPNCAAITPETMATRTWSWDYHPGALRYYQSIGVEPSYLPDLVARVSGRR